ncbi:MAG TPA: hypothetical protein DCX95_06365 [Elusimicrobia bacterium]|nr:hypothetical protein [Elusimicrobiota bacterium]
MKFNNIVDGIFSHSVRVKILRFLVNNETEMTGRELAGFCGVSHTQVYRSLGDLVSQGIVKMKRAGRAHLYSLNGKNIVVRDILGPFFKKEQNVLTNTVKNLFGKISVNLLSLVIFGSMADGTEKSYSDVDIFILVKDDKTKKLLEKMLPDIEADFYEMSGSRLSPVVFTLPELKKSAVVNKTLLEKIFSGKIIMGVSPREFVYGK